MPVAKRCFSMVEEGDVRAGGAVGGRARTGPPGALSASFSLKGRCWVRVGWAEGFATGGLQTENLVYSLRFAYSVVKNYRIFHYNVVWGSGEDVHNSKHLRAIYYFLRIWPLDLCRRRSGTGWVGGSGEVGPTDWMRRNFERKVGGGTNRVWVRRRRSVRRS